jgi:uncharacterized protein (TIGR03437 family)
VFKAILCGLFFCALAAAQAITSAGYLPPAPVSAAPGQILTFFVDGVGTTKITATLRQGSDIPVPVIDVRSVSTCPSLVSIPEQNLCGTITAVTVQIPYEVFTLCPACLRPVGFLPTQLIVSGNGHSASIELFGLNDQVHVLTSCDIVMTTPGNPPPANTTGLPCSPVVTRADGSMVGIFNPAKVGETLTAWATGLGVTNPAATTGKPSTKALPTAETFGIHFNYSPNALATKPRPPFVPAPTPAPAYTGLAAGFLGLYQINFVVPQDPPNGTPRCSLPGGVLATQFAVYSNLTVSFGGAFSFDGAGICVETRIPVD